MSPWRTISRGLRALTRRHRTDADIATEVSHFLELAELEYVRQGLSPEAAKRAALAEIGNATTTVEQIRSFGWENAVESLIVDTRYALRRLRASPGFTLVSVLTLALGIGATTAIFSVVNPILLRPLPYPDADRLLTIAERNADGSTLAPTFGTYVELRTRARSLQSLAASDRWQPSLTGTTEPERLQGQRVTASFFRTLGIMPSVGRDFIDGEDQPGAPKVAILSDRLLQRRFGGDRSIVGRQVTLDGTPYLVVGVMPPKFTNALAPTADIWSPLTDRGHAPFNSREWGHHYQMIARVATSVDMDASQRELAAIARTPIQEFERAPWASMKAGLLVTSLADQVVADAKPSLIAIIGAALLLLAIACVNVTNLLLGRGAQRVGELAMRSALGAGRRRLLAQLLTESVVLAVIGGAAGLVLTRVGVSTLIALSPPGLPRVDAVAVNGPVLTFALGLTALVGLVAGLVPAIGGSRAALSGAMQRSSRRLVGGRGFARTALVITEVGLALVLLVGAGLLTRSLMRLFAVTPGFEPSHVLTAQVVGTFQTNDTTRRQFFEDALSAVRQLPGVSDAAFTSQLPLSGEVDGYGYDLQSQPSIQPGGLGSALRYVVTPHYFDAMRIPLISGRVLDASDRPGAPESVVISQSLARRLFGNANPIGQRMRFGPEAGSEHPWDIVVGVVGDVKQESLAASQVDAFYVALGQWSWVDNVQSIVVRTTGDAAALAPSVKQAIWSVGKDHPIQRVSSMDALISASGAQRRFALVVIEAFALAALVLAAIGLYGVIAGGVTERTREIGIRMALGATSSGVALSVVSRGVLTATFGVAIGLIGAVAASRLLASLLFSVSRLDVTTYASVSALLVGIAALASWVPARRAANVDPSMTMRSD